MLVGALVATAWMRSRRRATLFVALLWLAYAGYEWLMFRRVLCSGECNIRVDLLLLWPLLAGATLWLVATGLRRWRARLIAGRTR